MRSTLASLTCLALLASCSPKAPPPAGLQAAPVAMALLEETGRRCDAMGQHVRTRWQASAPLTATARETRAVVGFIVRKAGTRKTQEIAILQEEAERRVIDLEAQHDPKAALLRALVRETREHCAAVMAPAASSLPAYTQDLETHQGDRDLALEEARQGAASLSVEGNRQIASIYTRIAALKEPEPPVRPIFERRAAAAPAPAATEPGPDMTETLKRLEASLQGLSKGGAVPLTGFVVVDSWSWRRVGGNIRVEGSVRNPGFAPLDLGHAVARFSTASGDLIETREIPFDTGHLAPNESSHFSSTLGDTPRIQICRLSFTDSKGQSIQAIGDVELEKAP